MHLKASSVIPAALFFSILATTAQAEVACAPREAMITRLTEKYGEVRAGIGTRGPESILEIYASPLTGSWSAVMTYADGRSCVVAVGANWSSDPDVLAGAPT